MAETDNTFFENLLFDYMEQIKFLLSPNEWTELTLDYSKNEILTMLFIYKNKKVTSSDIASYIDAPLNTVTGVVNRLERKKVIERSRDTQDKRVVNIYLTESGKEMLSNDIGHMVGYFKKIYDELTENERDAMFSIITKAISILKSGDKTNSKKKIRKINIE